MSNQGTTLNLGDWALRFDRAATSDAYLECTAGGTNTCECVGCRNFCLARERVYPQTFLELLETLGVAPLKDGEVYHVGREENGLHGYGGWFHFVGELIVDGDFAPVVLAPDFAVTLSRANAPRLESLMGKAVVQLEMICNAVPWLIDEPEVG